MRTAHRERHVVVGSGRVRTADLAVCARAVVERCSGRVVVRGGVVAATVLAQETLVQACVGSVVVSCRVLAATDGVDACPRRRNSCGGRRRIVVGRVYLRAVKMDGRRGRHDGRAPQSRISTKAKPIPMSLNILVGRFL